VVEDWDIDGIPPASQPDTGFQILTLKGFVDGAMGSDTAWLLEDFEHRPGYRGIGMVSEYELTHAVRQAMKLGYRFALHAIGDRANRTVLNAYQTAGVTPEQRFRIEHAQLVATSDIPRFGQLGVIASMQPIHCTDDMSWKITKIGLNRVKNAYPWRSLIQHGARLAFGSDWPVANHNPMAGLRAAVTRKSADGLPKDGWNTNEAVILEEALDIYTRGGAYGAGWENQIGTLEPGQYADFVILNHNLFDLNPLEFDNVMVNQTWIDGELVMET
jgi:predicted amidohydrolase YtcJ